MIGNVDSSSGNLIGAAVHDKCKVALEYLDILVEGCSKRLDLHVVSVRAALCHATKVGLKDSVDIFWRGLGACERLGISVDVFAFGLSTSGPAIAGVNELLVIVRILRHVVNDSKANLSVMLLVAIELV